MDKDLAKLIAITAFSSSANINNLIPLIKEHCDEAEYKVLSLAIASVSAEIGYKILNKIFSSYPELETEFEETIRKFGRPV